MDERHRARLAFHGAVVLLVGLLCGIAAVTEPEGQPMPSWQAAHGGLLLNGVWMLAVAGIAPFLVLQRSHAEALFWSLLSMVYGFMGTLVIQASSGFRGVAPEGPLANWVAFAGNLVVVTAAFFAAVLTAEGARGWVRQSRQTEVAAPAVTASGLR